MRNSIKIKNKKKHYSKKRKIRKIRKNKKFSHFRETLKKRPSSRKNKTKKKQNGGEKKGFWGPGNYWKKWGLVNLLPKNIRNSIWFYRTAKYGPPPFPKF